MRRNRNGRPGVGIPGTASVSTAIKNGSSVTAIEDQLEQRRRVRLRRDLNRIADRLAPYDRPAAALARAWAREVA